jgi:hypothetical protein
LIPEARLLNYVTSKKRRRSPRWARRYCIRVVCSRWRKTRFPLHIRCTFRPRLKGTVIAENIPHSGDKVKAIVSKDDITLISIESPAMWHKSVFSPTFSELQTPRHVDQPGVHLETNVTISLDKIDGGFHNEAINY